MEENTPPLESTPPPEPTPSPEPPPPAEQAPVRGSPVTLQRGMLVLLLVVAALIEATLLASTWLLSQRLDQIRATISDIGSRPTDDAPSRREARAPVRVDPAKLVAPDDPVLGPADAPVTIVEFSDYECPFCGRFFEQTLPVLRNKFGDKIRLVYKDFPLPMHANAPKAHEAAHCAGEQGKYWQYHDLLFQNQRALGPDQLRDYARRLNLDEGKFNVCLDGSKYAERVSRGRNLGSESGVTGTPTFFINGEMLVGAQPSDVFVAAIERALKK